MLIDLPELTHQIFACDGCFALVHAHAGGSFVDQVNGLVRQEAVGNVARAEFRSGFEGFIANFQAVVLLVLLADTTQDSDGLLDGRLLHHDRLEAAFQGGIALDILAVLVDGGGANHLQFAA